MRLAIIGPPGSGKTTLARHLGKLLDVPVHHLDRYFWQTGWRKVSSERRAKILGELLRGESWIVEGSYTHCQASLIAAADVVLMMATPRCLCVWRVFKRHWSRGERTDLPEGCRDRLSVWMLWKIAWWCHPYRRTIPGAIKYPQTREENAMDIEEATEFANKLLSHYGAREEETVNIHVTRLGGTVSVQVNGGPITTLPRPEKETLILEIDGEEVDRKEIGPNETYHISLFKGVFSLVIREKETPDA